MSRRSCTSVIPANRSRTRATYLSRDGTAIVTRIMTIAIATTSSSSVKPFLRTCTPCMKRFHCESIPKGLSDKRRERQSKKPGHQGRADLQYWETDVQLRQLKIRSVG